MSTENKEQKPINRTLINTWQDERVVDAVKATGRRKLIIAGLWTEICVAMPAIQAAGEGFEVFAVTDASGGVSKEAHEMAVLRMVRAGVVPITWMAVLGEWQRHRAREKTVQSAAEIQLEHGGASGVAFAWELQLLATPADGAVRARRPGAGRRHPVRVGALRGGAGADRGAPTSVPGPGDVTGQR